jgi:hypothetical protein
MEITPDTKIKALLDAYPSLAEYLIGYDPAFTKLRNTVLRNTVLRVASVADAANMADVDVDRLVADLHAEVARVSDRPPTAPQGDASRQEVLKSIIRELHDGARVEDVKARFDELVHDVDSTEIAAMEQAIIAEGVPVQDVMRLCDVHVSVFKDALETAPPTDAPPGHPVHTYRAENEELASILASLRRALGESSERPDRTAEILDLVRRLAAVDVHYTRKENQLFPLLETHGITGPTQVMWGIHDDIRARLRSVLASLESGDATAAEALPEILGMIEDMAYKEEHILFPVAIETLSAEEWASMADGESAIGFAWIAGPAAFGPVAVQRITPADIHSAELPSAGLPLTTGRLTPGQLDLMLRALPLDVTYVDAEDRVRYYSEGTRVFPRSPAVIGRAVTNCHPPASVDKVVAILYAFRAGEKDSAEFWITLGERFVSIRYFALRNADGVYQGCLEVTQDLTDLRALEGERRLLDW